MTNSLARHPWRWALPVFILGVVCLGVPPVGLLFLAAGGAFLLAGYSARQRMPAAVNSTQPRRIAAPPPPLQAAPVVLTAVGTGYHSGVEYLRPGPVPAELRREPANKHDQNAIAVRAGTPLRKCGYVAAELAALIAPEMDRRQVGALPVEAEFGRGLRFKVPPPFSGSLGLETPGAVTAARGAAPATSDPVMWPAVAQPWGALTVELEVEEERGHRDEVARVFANRRVKIGGQDSRGSEIDDVPGVLALSASIPGRIFVVLDGMPVGYLDRPDASRFADAVQAADTAGRHIPCRARVWAVDDSGTVRSRVTIWVPEPDLIDPPGPLPSEPHVVLPPGSKVQVTGEEAYLSELAAILAGRPEAPAVATLHEIPPVGRATKSRVQVRVGGQPVGLLSPTMGEHFLPTLRICAQQGLMVVCQARVKGDAAKVDVVLDAAKSADLSLAWIAKHIQRPVTKPIAIEKAQPVGKAADDRGSNAHDSGEPQ